MDTHRKTAIAVGVLFIVATAVFMIGQTIYDPILGASGYLDNAYPDRMRVKVGILFELVGVLAIPLIPVFLYPVLKKHSEALALGYVAIRTLEAMLIILAVVGSLSLINLSQSYLDGGGIDVEYFQILGSSIQSISDWSFLISVSFVFTLGALMLNYVLYVSRLVPRFISVWGLIAAALLLLGSILIMFEVLDMGGEPMVELVLTLPIAINEMVLAIWLIAKGFDPAAVASAPVKPDVNRFTPGYAR